MRKDKNLVFEMRKQGKSYRQIQQVFNISRSTLSDWFRDVDWSKHTKNKNNENNLLVSTERLKKMHIGRLKMLDDLYKKNEIQAVIEYEVFKKQPLFMAGLMIYAGEGDKRSRNVTRISNTDFYLHEIFIQFAEKYLKISRSSVKIALLLYSDNNINHCILKWSETLKISSINFHKTQVIKGKETKRKLQYGTGISIISTITVTKMKILTWLELCKKDFLSNDAAIV